MRVEIVKVHRLFEPGRLELFEPTCQINGVENGVGTRIGDQTVHHDVDVWADGLADGTNERHITPKPLHPVSLIAGQIPFHGRESALDPLDGALCRLGWLRREAEHAGIGADALTSRPAKQLVDRRIPDLADQIPEAEIENRQRWHAAPCVRTVKQLLPKVLHTKRVFAKQQLSEGFDLSRTAVAQAGQPFVSLNLREPVTVRADLVGSHPLAGDLVDG
jgi:hypothetical protein